jgi:hypothetical protein
VSPFATFPIHCLQSLNRNETPQSGLSHTADVRSRSIRIRNLPPGAQEGLLQQVLEKIVPVKRVEVFLDKQEAVVELPGAAVSQSSLPCLCY